MNDIPEVVEDLFYQIFTIPDKKDWPKNFAGNDIVAHDLYSFYYGLQMGIRLSSELGLSPAEGSAPLPPDD